MFKNYNMNQLVLPLDLEINLHDNDIAFSINHLVESIPENAFDTFLHHTGCPSYHPRMMLNYFMRLHAIHFFWTKNRRSHEG